MSAFLKFTTTGGVKLTATAGLFGEGTELTFNEAGEHYVAINAVEATLTATATRLNKTTTKAFNKGMIYNLNELSPVYRVYVTAQPKSSPAEWTKVNVYSWVEGGIDNAEWPGVDVTANKETINGYAYNYFEYPTTFNGQNVNVIANNGTAQTGDINLGTLDKDYYVVYGNTMEEVYTTAPAAGSIEEYVAPVEKKMIYMKDACGWSSDNAIIYAYFWTPNTWVKMTDDDGDKIYECELPEGNGIKNVIFVRKSTDGEGWSNVWNQTADLTLPTDGKNMWTMSEWSTGSWSTKQ